MKVLLDTHIAIWAIADMPELSTAARNTILNSGNEIYVSDISAWEVAVKTIARPGSVPFSASGFMNACELSGYRFLPISHDAIATYETLNYAQVDDRHKGPFDRLLIAQAKTTNMLFLTHDEVLRLYKEPLVVIV